MSRIIKALARHITNRRIADCMVRTIATRPTIDVLVKKKNTILPSLLGVCYEPEVSPVQRIYNTSTRKHAPPLIRDTVGLLSGYSTPPAPSSDISLLRLERCTTQPLRIARCIVAAPLCPNDYSQNTQNRRLLRQLPITLARAYLGDARVSGEEGTEGRRLCSLR